MRDVRNQFLVLVLLIVLAFTAWCGQTGGASLLLDPSDKFREGELLLAADCVKWHFKLRFPQFRLTAIRYDETISDQETRGILNNKTSPLHTAPENIVTLLCDFDTGRNSSSFDPYTSYQSWKVTLVRGNESSGWWVMSSGYA